MNPVYKNELMMMARSKQLPIITGIFDAGLMIVSFIILFSIRNYALSYGKAPYEWMLEFYISVLTMVVCLLCLFVPPVASSAIAGERERQTLDILLATQLTSGKIVLGKLVSCISLAVILLFSSLPILTIAMMYGGIGVDDIYRQIVYVVFIILWIGCIGIFCSCYFRKTTYACIASYGVITLFTAGTGLLGLLIHIAYSASENQGTLITACIGILYLLWLFNPGITYIMIFCRQIGDVSLYNLLDGYGIPHIILSHWILLSLCVQFVFMGILLYMGIKKLNPLNEKKINLKNKRK